MSVTMNQNRVRAGKHRGRFTFADKQEGAVSVGPLAGLPSGDFPDVGAADQAELRLLADSADPLVRADLLSSTRLPNDVLHKLYQDDNLSVQLAAVNEGTDPTITAAASRHPDHFIRAAAFGRHDLAEADRHRLSQDSNVQHLMGLLSE